MARHILQSLLKRLINFKLCLSLITLIFLSPVLGDKLYNAQTFTLSNGLSVVVIENHRVPIVTQLICYKVGSADDPVGKSGLAHYLEHMMFKGGKNSAGAQIMSYVDNVGGQINAMTSFDSTIYYATVPKLHLEKVMEFEAERMSLLKFNAIQAKTELNVILEERHMTVGNRPKSAFDIDLNSLFYRHHPYKIPIIGWENEIKSYTPDDVNQLYKKFYGPNNTVLILYGDITLSEAKRLVKKYYGSIAPRQTSDRRRVTEPENSLNIVVTKKSNQVNTTTMVFKFKTPSFDRIAPKDFFALSVIGNVLANTTSSILYQVLVNDLNLVTQVTSYYEYWALEPRSFSIIVELNDNVSTKTVEVALMKCIDLIAQRGFSENQIKQYKQQYQSQLILMKDDFTGKITEFAYLIGAGIPIKVQESEPEIIDSLTVQDFNRAFQSTFMTSNYLLGILMPQQPITSQSKL